MTHASHFDGFLVNGEITDMAGPARLGHVSRALGHRDISTTGIYTHLVDGRIEEALERL